MAHSSCSLNEPSRPQTEIATEAERQEVPGKKNEFDTREKEKTITKDLSLKHYVGIRWDCPKKEGSEGMGKKEKEKKSEKGTGNIGQSCPRSHFSYPIASTHARIPFFFSSSLLFLRSMSRVHHRAAIFALFFPLSRSSWALTTCTHLFLVFACSSRCIRYRPVQLNHGLKARLPRTGPRRFRVTPPHSLTRHLLPPTAPLHRTQRRHYSSTSPSSSPNTTRRSTTITKEARSSLSQCVRTMPRNSGGVAGQATSTALANTLEMVVLHSASIPVT